MIDLEQLYLVLGCVIAAAFAAFFVLFVGCSRVGLKYFCPTLLLWLAVNPSGAHVRISLPWRKMKKWQWEIGIAVINPNSPVMKPAI
jgi:hypothetical protein